MNILTNWLRHYVPTIPVDDRQLADDLTLRGIAVEGVHSLGATVDGKSNGSLFEMDITTNRVDAMNHYGIAREGATIYNLPLSPLLAGEEQNAATKDVATKNAVILSEAKNPRISSEAPQSFPIRIEAKDLCGRFTAQILRNITIAPSTGRISEYFTLLSQKQISNAVDASNFVLLGMGHPTHAFDLDKLEGGIVVRLARKGEKLKLLDGTDRILEPDDLVVADENKALALAGVMGGYDSMITAETKNILVEAAWFDPAAIRRSSRRHGLHTDASHRFERGADFNACPTANALVSQLILENGGHAEGRLIDVLIPEIEARTALRPPITLSVKQVQRHLGATLDDTPNHSALTADLIHQYLTALGCTLTASRDTNPGAPSSRPPQGRLSLGLQPQGIRESEPSLSSQPEIFQVQLPSWRLDLEREIDLIEEVARVYGYNRFANTLPTAMPVIAHPLAAKEAAVRTRLLALGFSESISSTFASQQDAALFYTAAENPRHPTEVPGTATNPGAPSSRPFLAAKVGIRDSEPSSSNMATKTPGTIPLENPLSEEATLLRPSLVPGMLTMLAHNLNRDVKEVRLFEQGHIFTGTTHQVNETSQLSLGLTTAQPQTTPLHTATDAPFFELKGAIESVLSLFDLSKRKEDVSSRPERSGVEGPAVSFTVEAPQWLQPGRSATALLNGAPIAHFGELAHTQRDQRKLRQPIYLAQLDLAKLYELPLKKVTAHDLSRFQAVERDFSFTFPDTMQWQTIAAAIHALAIPELQRLTPTEIFRDPKGKSVPPSHYALLLKCVFQSNDRTLREDELTTWWSTIIVTLTNLGGTIRAPGAV
jgi:phenylalanyl-tRNA synthetase beta chain